MTPKEKAKELLDKFLDITLVDYLLTDTAEQVNAKCIKDLELCKQCALIAVDEILKVLHTNIENRYFQEVKSEINKL